MNLLKIATLILTTLILTACASSRSGDVYTREQARREMTVRHGIVESVREVLMEGTHSGTGTMAGAAIGGVAGSNIGGGRGSIVGAIVGALIGGMAGSAAEENLTKKNALEITVRLDNGQTVAVVQEMGDVFHPGQRVRVLSDYHSSRVTH